MTPRKHHNDPGECAATRALLDPYLSDELGAEERAIVEAHLETCTACAAELVESRRVRDALRRAVYRTATPAGLADRVRAQRAAGAPDAAPKTPIAGRLGTVRRWLYAAAATLVIALGGWLLLRREPYRPPIASNLPAPEAQLAAVLGIGLVDHIECAVRYGYADEEYTHEEILDKLDEEYAGLASIVRDRAPGYRMSLGHHCTFNGREYIHMILKKDTSVISLAITEQRPDDTLPGPSLAASDAGGLPIYATRLDGYEVAGFESGRFLVFAVSDMARPDHIALANALARPVDGFLRRKEDRG